MSLFDCKACAPADPSTQTVKVDFAALAATEAEAAAARLVEKESQREEERRLAEPRAQEELARRARDEAEAASEAEARRLQAEEAKAAAEAAAAAAAAEAEEAEAAAVAVAAAESEERRHQEEITQDTMRKRRVGAWLKEHSYTGINAPRKTYVKTKCPIHTAAKLGDAKLVEMLLLEGADSAQRDSQGKTAYQVAEACNKGISHKGVFEILRRPGQPAAAAPRATRGGA